MRFTDWLKQNLLLVSIMVIGFILRVIGLNFGKPFRYHPDELKLVYQAGNLLNIHNWSKETFFLIGVYPPFFTYILAFGFAIYSIVILLLGDANSINQIRELYYLDPFSYHMIGRWISVLSGTILIFLIYRAGKLLYSKTTGLIAAAFWSVTFLPVRNSHFGVVDIFLTMLVFISFVFAIHILKNGKTKNYIYAGIFAGLATATKWQGGIVLLPLITAHFMYIGRQSLIKIIFHRNLWGLFLVFGLTFTIACPLVYLDFNEFYGGVLGTAKFMEGGSKKLEAGGTFWSYFTGNHSPGYGPFSDNTFGQAVGFMTTILFSIGTVVLLFRHKKQDILLIVLPLTMYMVLGKMNYKAMRHVLPMVPFLHIIAAKVLELFGNLLQGIKFKKLVVVLLVAVVIIPQGIKSFRYDTALLQTDTRTLLKTWIEKNLPAYTSIGTEEFGPSLLSEWDLNLNLIKRSPQYKNIYKVYGLVPGMFAHGGRFCKSHSPINFIMKNNIQYIILDSFTRARYTWPISREKNPDAVRSRKLFYLWVKEHGELVKIIKPENDFNISPALEVYRLNIRYNFTGGYSVNFNGQ